MYPLLCIFDCRYVKQVSLKIRLKRMGMKKQPTYKIVVADSRKQRDGRAIEILGSYSPQRKDKPLVIDTVKLDKWLSVGAVPTESAKKLVDRAKKHATETGETKFTLKSAPKPPKPKAKAKPAESEAAEKAQAGE
jgi:small subunit ribosomal protein S16